MWQTVQLGQKLGGRRVRALTSLCHLLVSTKQAANRAPHLQVTVRWKQPWPLAVR